MSTTQNEPDFDHLIMLVARAIHGDIVGIDFDSLDDGERAELLDTAYDVLDALDRAGLTVVRSFSPQGTD